MPTTERYSLVVSIQLHPVVHKLAEHYNVFKTACAAVKHVSEFLMCVYESACTIFFNSHLCMCLRYMLMGGAMNLWMLQVGRFLTGVAGGMTAASIPVGHHGYRSKVPHVYVIYPHGFLPEFILHVVVCVSFVCLCDRFTSQRSPTKQCEALWAPALRLLLCLGPCRSTPSVRE